MEDIKKYLQDKKGIQCIAENYTDDYIHVTNTVHILVAQYIINIIL